MRRINKPLLDRRNHFLCRRFMWPKSTIVNPPYYCGIALDLGRAIHYPTFALNEFMVACIKNARSITERICPCCYINKQIFIINAGFCTNKKQVELVRTLDIPRWH